MIIKNKYNYMHLSNYKEKINLFIDLHYNILKI